jgi:capsular polysaccharide export protein
MFGDCRPVHRSALPVTRAAGARNHIIEEGYYRPWWFTLEREGVNHYSTLPRDPDWYLQAVNHLPEQPRVQHFRQSFAVRACHDVAYHLAGALNPLVFPTYQTHATHPAPAEYTGYIRRFARLIRDRAADSACVADWLAARGPLFVFPLQLDGDTQIGVHSRFSNMDEAISEVLASFARDAAPDARLLVKNHPLDYRWLSRRKALARRVAAFNLAGRVGFIETGPLEPLLDAAAGVVTVNSTVGLAALGRGRAVCTLGDVIYHMRGLTHQGPLARFWQNPTLPDPALHAAFSRVVMQLTQINGGLYGTEAIGIGIANLLPRLAADQAPVAELTAKLGV